MLFSLGTIELYPNKSTAFHEQYIFHLDTFGLASSIANMNILSAMTLA